MSVLLSQMRNLIRNELEKIVFLNRFFAVLFVYLVFDFLLSFGPHPDALNLKGTAASVSFEWLQGGLTQTIYPLLTAIMIGDTVAGESSAGTLKMLLVAPADRWKVWLSKFLSALIATEATLLFSGCMVYIFLGIDEGFGFWHDPAAVSSGYRTAWDLTWRVYGWESLSVVSIVGVFTAVSTFTKSGPGAVGICAGVVLLGMFLTTGPKPAWGQYLPLEHWQIVGHLTSSFPLTGCSLTVSAAVLVFWIVICTGLGMWRFQRQDVT